MLSELMPEAAPVGGIAVPEEPELVPELLLVPLLAPLPEGMREPDGGVDGMVDGLVDGDVDGGLIGAGVDVSSIFLPQAPRTTCGFITANWSRRGWQSTASKLSCFICPATARSSTPRNDSTRT